MKILKGLYFITGICFGGIGVAITSAVLSVNLPQLVRGNFSGVEFYSILIVMVGVGLISVRYGLTDRRTRLQFYTAGAAIAALMPVVPAVLSLTFQFLLSGQIDRFEDYIWCAVVGVPMGLLAERLRRMSGATSWAQFKHQFASC